MVYILRIKNLWFLFHSETKQINGKDLDTWEDRCDQARGLIIETIYDSLHVHTKDKDNSIEVWKNLASLFDKNVDVSAYSLENKIYEFSPKYFDRIAFCC